MPQSKTEGSEGKRPKTGGRQKGSQNKTTRSAKEAIAFAAEGLGGGERLMAWAKSDKINERVFWSSIYPKLIPVTLAGDEDNPLHLISHIQLVALK